MLRKVVLLLRSVQHAHTTTHAINQPNQTTKPNNKPNNKPKRLLSLSFSYEDVLITPAADALEEALKGTSVDVEFSLSGEQGLSNFAYPNSWLSLMSKLRSRLAGVGGGGHQYGIAFNWDKVCGCVEPKERDPLLYNRTYVERLGRWRADSPPNKLMGPTVVDVAGAKRLIEASGEKKRDGEGREGDGLGSVAEGEGGEGGGGIHSRKQPQHDHNHNHNQPANQPTTTTTTNQPINQIKTKPNIKSHQITNKK